MCAHRQVVSKPEVKLILTMVYASLYNFTYN